MYSFYGRNNIVGNVIKGKGVYNAGRGCNNKGRGIQKDSQDKWHSIDIRITKKILLQKLTLNRLCLK